jgi:curved DNA-binding protein CbpA
MDEHASDGHSLSYYDLLQVSPRADLEVIQAAYRVLARSYHPDVSQDPNAARLMRALNAAYEVLSDSERRARYDAESARTARVRSGPRRSETPRRSHTRRQAATVLVEPGTVSPAARVIFVLLVMTLVAAIGFGLWLVYDVVQDRPPGVLHPLDRAAVVAFHGPHDFSPGDLGSGPVLHLSGRSPAGGTPALVSG